MRLRTIYQKIWSGEAPSYPLYRFDQANGSGGGLLAILDIFPATPGHTLVISEAPVEKWTDLSDTRLLQAAQLGAFVGRHMEAALSPLRIVRVTFGNQVPHFHDQLIPNYEGSDVIDRLQPNSGRMDARASHDELSAMQERLAFPPDLASKADAKLAQIASQAVLL
jgi:histidine triad (HIT) family protein